MVKNLPKLATLSGHYISRNTGDRPTMQQDITSQLIAQQFLMTQRTLQILSDSHKFLIRIFSFLCTRETLEWWILYAFQKLAKHNFTESVWIQSRREICESFANGPKSCCNFLMKIFNTNDRVFVSRLLHFLVSCYLVKPYHVEQDIFRVVAHYLTIHYFALSTAALPASIVCVSAF